MIQSTIRDDELFTASSDFLESLDSRLAFRLRGISNFCMISPLLLLLPSSDINKLWSVPEAETVHPSKNWNLLIQSFKFSPLFFSGYYFFWAIRLFLLHFFIIMFTLSIITFMICSFNYLVRFFFVSWWSFFPTGCFIFSTSTFSIVFLSSFYFPALRFLLLETGFSLFSLCFWSSFISVYIRLP